MELTVKVDLKHAGNAAAQVRRVLNRVVGSRHAKVEEVFPELRAGRSAGLVSVTLACEPGSKEHRASVKALREDGAVVRVAEPKRRRPL